jgi:hypothetical protein
MEIGQLGWSSDERQVQTVGAQLRQRIAGRAFPNLDFDARTGLPILRD